MQPELEMTAPAPDSFDAHDPPPEEKVLHVPDEKRVQQGTIVDDPDRFRYVPLLPERKRIRRLEGVFTFISASCLIVIAYLIPALMRGSYIPLVSLFLLLIVSLIIAVVITKASAYKANKQTGFIKLTPEYLQISSSNDLKAPWRDLVSADALEKPSRRIVLSFNTSNWSAQKRSAASNWGKTLEYKQDLVFDLHAISERRRQHFLLQLRKHIPSSRLTERCKALLSAKEETLSFTELWMDSIKDGALRRSVCRLEAGTMVHNQRYEVIRFVGSGGQGTAYEAIDHFADTALGEPSRVILKEFVLPVHGDQDKALLSLKAVEHEEAILRLVASKYIANLLDSFVDDYRAYLVIEFIDGQTLRQMVDAKGALSDQEAIVIGQKMCCILNHLHSFTPPIIHRDFTPENLILSKDGDLKLIDFDVARQEDAAHSNQVVGKPSYIAPEQFRGQALPVSDIYSWGASMFFLLTGREPTPIQASRPSAYSNTVPEVLDSIIFKSTAALPDERFHSADEIRRLLEDAAV